VVLVGRWAERAAIEALLAGARVGASGALVLTGEAGVGKSVLLEEAARLAAGMRLLRATGSEVERELPFGGLLQLLRPALPALPALPPPQVDALRAALALGPAPGPGAAVDRFTVGAATLGLIGRLAEDRPLAVLVDDAHLLDSPSAQALLFAARRLLADPVAVVVTSRSGEPSVLADADLPVRHVGGLGVEDAAALLAARTGSPVPQDLVRRAHAAAGGNPLALLELPTDLDPLAFASPEVPPPVGGSLVEAFGRRARTLAPAARTALLVAAVVGGDLPLTAAACSRLGVGVEALTEAEAAGLVTLGAGRVGFRHPLVRSAVHEDADPAARRAAHAAAAAVLPAADVERRAWHLAEAAVGPDDDAADLLTLAAGRARRRGADAVAASALHRAAGLTADPGSRALRLLGAGEAAHLAGLPDRAEALLLASSGIAPDAVTAARAAGLRGSVAARAGSLETARSLLLEAATTLEPVDPDAAARLLAETVDACFWLGDAGTAAVAADRAADLLGRVRDPVAAALGRMAAGMGRVLAGASGSDDIGAAVEALTLRGGPPADPGQTVWWLVGVLWLRGSGPHRGLVDRAVDQLRQTAAVGVLPHALVLVARDDATGERWVRARAGYLEAVRLARETAQSTDLAAALAGLAWLEARLGDEAACRRHADEALTLARRHQVHVMAAWASTALGELELGLGRPRAAVVYLREVEALLERLGVSDPDLWPSPELAEVLVRMGDARGGSDVARRYGERAAAKGGPWAMARAARAAGLAAADEDVDRHFAAALALHARTPDVFERARTELGYGSRLRRARRRVAAREHLRAALDTFERLGARPWADQAAAELAATGEHVHRRGTGDLEELTPQEVQVALALADGRTTRQAAAALFLSPKTVEYHLRHVYLKLGIRSRAELADAVRARH
jgi:DNA-binding CsgD family transcriptional regulator